MKELEKDFYAQLGLLSVLFAKMEYKLTVIIRGLLATEEDLIAVIVTERNTLYQNLELLKKINQVKCLEEDKIIDLIEKIDNIRTNRNLFIHGVWQPIESDNQIEFACEEIRLKYGKDKNSGQQSWSYNKFHFFNLVDIKKQIGQIEEIIRSENTLIKILVNENDIFADFDI